jgi:protein ImuB
MQQRFLYIWFPRLATDRCQTGTNTQQLNPASPNEVPFAVTRSDHLGVFLTGCNKAARVHGLNPMMRLADARAIIPELLTRDADPNGDLMLLQEMARFGERFSPWIAIDRPDQTTGEGGLWLDMSGGAHLFGGEKALMATANKAFQKFHCSHRLGLADTAAAAWAAARHHSNGGLLESGTTTETARTFPLDALRLDDGTLRVLNRLGLRQIADLYPIPRANMTTRFGPDVLLRLDQFLGRYPEHLAFEHSPRVFEVRQHWPESLGAADIIERAVEALLKELCQTLRKDGRGLRSLGLRFVRVDHSITSLITATSAPCQDADHLMRLLSDRLPGVDAGFGIETIEIRAFQTQHIDTEQAALINTGSAEDDPQVRHKLVDRLAQRLGTHSVYRFGKRQSYLAERVPVRMSLSIPEGKTGSTTAPDFLPTRPIRLINPAEDVEVIAYHKGHPTELQWRRLTLHAVSVQGPERIMREWWRNLQITPWDHKHERRDYYRFDDHNGRSLWLCRRNEKQNQQRWFVHGWFGDPLP